MEIVRHEGTDLRYVTVHPDNYQPERIYPLIILLHGFGANMSDLAGLAPAIDRNNYIFACPNAPFVFEIGNGVTGYGWAPPRTAGEAQDFDEAVRLLEGFFHQVMEQYHTPPAQTILGGFSQGGILTYRCGLEKPDVFAGLVSLGAFLTDSEEIKSHLPTKRSQPIFIAQGDHDVHVPMERALQTKQFLEQQGYAPFYKEYPMGHEISQDVIDDLVPWIHQVLPTGTSF